MAFLVTFAVGTLRKYASGIFLVSDLGGYAAVAAAVFTQRDRAKVPRARKRETLLYTREAFIPLRRLSLYHPPPGR